MKSSRYNRSSLLRHLRITRIEWPTVALACVIYTAFGLLTWFDSYLPWWVVLPCGAYIVAWHSSLQHETTHGHPTSSPWINEAIVLPSLWLWLPYRSYRDSHLKHHHDDALTDPLEDPESYYLTLGQWLGYGRILQGLFWFTNTITGRLALGPLVAFCKLVTDEFPLLWRGDRKAWLRWGLHGLGCLIVLAWVMGVIGMSFWHYLWLYAYSGTALSMLRSFCEHRAANAVDDRTIIVEAEAPFALLFLNNNLHLLHHRKPGMPWYRLPGQYRENREQLLRDNNHYYFRGYWEIIARYLIWPKESPVHPLEPWRSRPVKQTRSRGPAP